jgi:uncharacterized membrane protein HdeD (DUF308 family)
MAKRKKEDEPRRRLLAENWKSIVGQGAIAIVIGVVILAVPDLSARVVSILLGALLLVYAVLSFVSGSTARGESEPFAWLFVRGAIAAAGGLVVLFWPSLKELGLLYILGVFAIAAGVLVGGAGLFQRWEKAYKGISGAGGLASVALGVVLISYAGSLHSSIEWIVGIYATAFGLLLVVLGMGARGVAADRSSMTA